MGHTEIVDGQLIEVEKVDLSQKDINEVCRHLGIHTSVRARQRSVRTRMKGREPYVRTIPLSWVLTAAKLPGKALHVGIALWYLAGITKSFTVTMTRARLERFGIQRETGRRGLLALEKANLVRVERSGRKSPRVTLYENSQLTDQQLQAIFLLVQGCSDREVAEELEVARETVCRWRHDNPYFIAELNRRRKELWDGAHAKLRGLIGKAADALEHALDQYDPKVAIELLKAMGVYGNVGAPGEPTKPAEVILKWAEVWASEELSRNGPSDDPLASLIMPTNRHVQLTRQRLE